MIHLRSYGSILIDVAPIVINITVYQICKSYHYLKKVYCK